MSKAKEVSEKLIRVKDSNKQLSVPGVVLKTREISKKFSVLMERLKDA